MLPPGSQNFCGVIGLADIAFVAEAITEVVLGANEAAVVNSTVLWNVEWVWNAVDVKDSSGSGDDGPKRPKGGSGGSGGGSNVGGDNGGGEPGSDPEGGGDGGGGFTGDNDGAGFTGGGGGDPGSDPEGGGDGSGGYTGNDDGGGYSGWNGGGTSGGDNSGGSSGGSGGNDGGGDGGYSGDSGFSGWSGGGGDTGGGDDGGGGGYSGGDGDGGYSGWSNGSSSVDPDYTSGSGTQSYGSGGPSREVRGTGTPVRGSGTNNPSYGTGGPSREVRGTGTPTRGSGTNNPSYGTGGPGRETRGTGTPVQGSGDRVYGSGMPIQGSGNEIHGTGTPIQGSGKPIEGSGTPIHGTGEPIQGSGKPIEGSGAPIHGTGEPIQGSGKPVRGSGSDLVKGAGVEDIRGSGIDVTVGSGHLDPGKPATTPSDRPMPKWPSDENSGEIKKPGNSSSATKPKGGCLTAVVSALLAIIAAIGYLVWCNAEFDKSDDMQLIVPNVIDVGITETREIPIKVSPSDSKIDLALSSGEEYITLNGRNVTGIKEGSAVVTVSASYNRFTRLGAIALGRTPQHKDVVIMVNPGYTIRYEDDPVSLNVGDEYSIDTAKIKLYPSANVQMDQYSFTAQGSAITVKRALIKAVEAGESQVIINVVIDDTVYTGIFTVIVQSDGENATDDSSEELKNNHAHKWIFVRETKPDCTNPGYKYYKCECGQTMKKRSGEPLGHDVYEYKDFDDFGNMYIHHYCNRCHKQID